MSHVPVHLKNISLVFPSKICFEGFTAHIPHGSRIGIIGQNGTGKSTLLKILHGTFSSFQGSLEVPEDVRMSYVPQTIEEFEFLSGGERLHKVLLSAFHSDPNMLLLDEPTNHLDKRNRKILLRRLQSYSGTLIVASHDVEILKYSVNMLWHIKEGKIHVFSGNYEDYLQESSLQRMRLETMLCHLEKEKTIFQKSLKKEQLRASKSRAQGIKHIERRKWPTVVSASKAHRASKTAGQKKAELLSKKESVHHQISQLRLPEQILPKFSIPSQGLGNRVLLSIKDGTIGYGTPSLLCHINLSCMPCERIALLGDNGSGKSTLLKGILNDPHVFKSGNWYTPKSQDIGYLDQLYRTLLPHHSILETMQNLCPTWSHAEIRTHLNTFLFRKNEQVHAPVYTLSGGEKARLCLAHIAAKTPKLLILDEVTNNLDLENRSHLLHVLKSYPGAMIVISHEDDFLKDLNIHRFYKIQNKTLVYQGGFS